jgi:hypothetical protein
MDKYKTEKDIRQLDERERMLVGGEIPQIP